MSTERPENDVTGPRRRRSPLAVASVAAAVLLTGGGAAYWASTAAGDSGTDADRAASGDSSPPLLALDLADSPSTQPPASRPVSPIRTAPVSCTAPRASCPKDPAAPPSTVPDPR